MWIFFFWNLNCISWFKITFYSKKICCLFHKQTSTQLKNQNRNKSIILFYRIRKCIKLKYIFHQNERKKEWKMNKRNKQTNEKKNVDDDYRLYNVFIAFINAPRNKVTLNYKLDKIKRLKWPYFYMCIKPISTVVM